MIVQSVVVPKSWGLRRARAWLKAHGYAAPKVDVTKNTLRFRQHDPRSCSSFGTIKMGKDVRAVVCCPRG